MIETVINILEYYGVTADKLGPIVLAGFGGWFLYKSLRAQIGGLEKDIRIVEKNIGDLDGDVEKLDGKFERKFSFLDSKISSIDRRVSFMEGGLKAAGKLKKRYMESFSPERLTEEGIDVLTESKAKEIIETNKQKILDRILADPKPTNAYDAQEKTREVIWEMKDDPIFVPIKEYVFQKGMNLFVVLEIIAVYFRDFVLEELGFKVDDCDGKR